jgi:nucleoside-diphosphate-sugar epimerase
MISPRVLLPSDVFPPRCGGAGWSAHALALALIERGHDVTAIVPRRSAKCLNNHGDHGDHRENNLQEQSSMSSVSSVVEDVLGIPTVRVNY